MPSASSHLVSAASPGVAYRASEEGARQYSSQPRPKPARGSAIAEQRAKILVQVARERGVELEGDGRLAEVARWVGTELDIDVRAPPRRAVDFYVRHLGVVDPIPNVLTMTGGTDEDAKHLLGETLSKQTNIGYNRFGLAVVTRWGQPVTVIVLQSSKVLVEPIDRTAAPMSTISLRGSLVGNFQSVVALMTPPNGASVRIGESRGSKFEFSCKLTTPGAHQIELMANGAYGPEVVANFPVFVGVHPPLAVEIAENGETAGTAAAGTSSAEAIQTEMFRLLNETRKAAGAPPLMLDPGLARLALDHSRDMVEANYFGHTSPTHGDIAARARSADLPFPLITENLARGASAEDMHGALLESPGHRVNMLNPKLTHVGIGVVQRGQGNFAEAFATQDFGAEATPLDPDKAPRAILDLLNDARKSHGLPALQKDPTLEQSAERAADLASRGGKTDEAASAAAVAELQATLRKAGAGNRIRSVKAIAGHLPSVDQATGLPAVLEPSAAYVGIAVIRRDRANQQKSNVVVLLGSSR